MMLGAMNTIITLTVFSQTKIPLNIRPLLRPYDLECVMKFFRIFSGLALMALCAWQPGFAASNISEFSALAEKAGPAVVNISTLKTVSQQDQFRDMFRMPRGGSPFDEFGDQFEKFFGDKRERPFKQRSLGSGFIISKDGLVVTNNHVVEGADEIKVSLRGGGKPLTAKLLGRDEEADLALLKIEDAKNEFAFLEFGNSEAARVGDWVVAIGSPKKPSVLSAVQAATTTSPACSCSAATCIIQLSPGCSSTVTAGIISAKGRFIGAGPFDNFLQTDASINPGNSGGPLLDLEGKVIGVNTAIVASGQGIGFAIPSNMASDIVNQLRGGEKVRRGWLGVTIQDVDENTAKALGLAEPKGALISQVVEGDPADKAGLRSGDVVLKVADKPVADSAQLLREIAGLKPGGAALLEVWRKGQTLNFSITLGERDLKHLSESGPGGKSAPGAPENLAKFGFSLRPVMEREAKNLGLAKASGLLVTEVTAGSAAEDSDIRAGDVILEVDQNAVSSLAELRKALDAAFEHGDVALLLVKRNRQSLFRTLLAPAKTGSK